MTALSVARAPGLRTLVGVLVLVTLVEWGIFAARHDVPKECIVPALLGLSSIKFAMVIDWYTRLRESPGRMARFVPTILVVAGGTSLALIAAFGT